MYPAIILALMLMMGMPARAQDIQDSFLTYITPFDQGAGEAKILDIINHAHKTIRIAAYGFTLTDVCDSLIAARNRGVDISLVVDATQAAGPKQKPIMDKLKRAGIDVLIGKSPVHGQLLHMKAIIIDEHIVEDGSFNLSSSADMQLNSINIIDSQNRAQIFLQAWQRIHDYLAGKE